MVASPAARRGSGWEPPKKRRRSKSPKDTREPIVFRSPGLKPDVRLTVVGQVFHVHSIILKLHSNFFRKFLDSADKVAAPASASFQYDYVSVFDADGAWGLEPAAAKATSSSSEKSFAEYPEAQAKEIEPFRKLLCSMYTRPYMINDVVELLTIVRIADYYCALPNLSGTISTALLGSPMFKRESYARESDSDESESEESEPENFAPSEFVQRAGQIIIAAKKLRHPILFRECFIHIVSSLHDFYSFSLPAFRDDKDLWLVLIEGISSLRRKILRTHHLILMICLDRHLEEDLRLDMRNAYFQNHPEYCSMGYRQLLAILDKEKHFKAIRSIEELLQNNLALDRTSFGAGEGPYTNRYLCAELEDEDMPWDAAESDW
ncbi:hypothetical protein BGZ57DRAFT_865733 [Hyaloscypha finlandica]|nr:hypothetical protein BGZ57DRAFT_865733 [Hyaloscypha finlandica]